MAIFNTIEEYESYLKGLSLAELLDVEAHIDRKAYPDRYELVRKYLSEKQRVISEKPPSSTLPKPEEDPEPARADSKSIVLYLVSVFILVIVILIVHKEIFTPSSPRTVLISQKIEFIVIIAIPLTISVHYFRKKESLKVVFLGFVVFGIIDVLLGFVINLIVYGKTVALDVLILKDYYHIGYLVYVGYCFIGLGFFNLIFQLIDDLVGRQDHV